MQKVSISLKTFIVIFILGFLVIIAYLGYAIFIPNNIFLNSNQGLGSSKTGVKPRYSLIIEQQESLTKVAAKLAADKVIRHPRLFILLTRIMGRDKKVTAGLYILNRPMSIFDIVQRISSGKPDQISITFVEGWTFRQIRSYINGLPNINHLTINQTESQIRASLKIDYPNMEGLLYPSTYFIVPNQSDLDIYRSAYRLMQIKLAKFWQSKNVNANNYADSYQLLIMASLIQKETSSTTDMFQISTVFNNRLRIGMRLQDDPAVFYGLGNKKQITRQEFQIDTPYNTYLHAGLPPTPICAPTESALMAAANPTNDYKLLYFISLKDGTNKFSYSYAEHTAAVKKYLKRSASKK